MVGVLLVATSDDAMLHRGSWRRDGVGYGNHHVPMIASIGWRERGRGRLLVQEVWHKGTWRHHVGHVIGVSQRLHRTKIKRAAIIVDITSRV
jgi:hypothetical protein